MISIAVLFIVSVTVASVLVYWHAVREVETEMRAAMSLGRRMVLNDINEEMARAGSDLQSMISDFEEDRHLRVSLVDDHGVTLTSSRPFAGRDAAPDWFYRLLASKPETMRVELPPSLKQHGAILLQTSSRNKIDDAWDDTTLVLKVLAIFCALVLGLVYWAVELALRPLQHMSAAFTRIGSRDYAARLAERGPRELADLCRGFNRMAGRLAEVEVQNRRLAEQLATVQEEERADLARDLHDEIGPLLFAMGVDLAATLQHDSVRSSHEVSARLDGIRAAVGEVQRHVKAILRRLRPPALVDLGLVHAVDNLVAFWQARYPQVRFDIDLQSDGLDVRMEAPIYRVIQESVSNAVRHGRPTRIGISVKMRDASALEVRISDDGDGLQRTGQAAGLGLLGMQERVQLLGGTLRIGTGSGGRGVTVLARMPVHVVADAPAGGMPHPVLAT